jgi:hypothetical protein
MIGAEERDLAVADARRRPRQRRGRDKAKRFEFEAAGLPVRLPL